MVAYLRVLCEYVHIVADFDKAVSILEKKLEGRSGDNGARRNLVRDSSKFNIAPKESDEGVMIEPSMLVTNHLQRKGSVLKMSKSAKGGGFSTASGSLVGSSGDGPRASAQSGNFPTGAHVPAAYYREIEEQLADALFKRCQAKLMADPDQANVEAALADGLKVCTSVGIPLQVQCPFSKRRFRISASGAYSVQRGR